MTPKKSFDLDRDYAKCVTGSTASLESHRSERIFDEFDVTIQAQPAQLEDFNEVPLGVTIRLAAT